MEWGGENVDVGGVSVDRNSVWGGGRGECQWR